MWRTSQLDVLVVDFDGALTAGGSQFLHIYLVLL